MVEIIAKMVSALRETTGAPMMKCKAALVEANGDPTRAEAILRERGVKGPQADAVGNQGHIAVYVHHGSQIVGLVELACATDFVARADAFREVANELAMQVAASDPMAIAVEDLSDVVREEGLRNAWAEIEADPKMAGKPDTLRDEVARNKAKKRLEEQCLLTQAYVRNPKMAVGSLLDDLRLKVREGIYVRRIARWQVGEVL